MDDADGRVVDAAAYCCCFVAFDNDNDSNGSSFLLCRGVMMQGMVEYKENFGAGMKGWSRCLASDVHLFMNLRFLDGVDDKLI